MNKEELEKVEQLIEQKDSEQLKDLLAGLHPADIAELCNELDAEEAARTAGAKRSRPICDKNSTYFGK